MNNWNKQNVERVFVTAQEMKTVTIDVLGRQYDAAKTAMRSEWTIQSHLWDCAHNVSKATFFWRDMDDEDAAAYARVLHDMIEIIRMNGNVDSVMKSMRAWQYYTRADGMWIDRLLIDIAWRWDRLYHDHVNLTPGAWTAAAIAAGLLESLEGLWEASHNPDARALLAGIFAAYDKHEQEVENYAEALRCACYIVCGIQAL